MALNTQRSVYARHPADGLHHANSLLARMRRLLGGESEDCEPNTDTARRHERVESAPIPLLRFGTSRLEAAERPISAVITVRRQVCSMEDARFVVNGLRDGHAQLLNLSQAPADIAIRLVDFLTGAVEALEGEFEPIGTLVYLFSPRGIDIDIDQPPSPSASKFFGR